jgi:hypothetical protein
MERLGGAIDSVEWGRVDPRHRHKRPAVRLFGVYRF